MSLPPDDQVPSHVKNYTFNFFWTAPHRMWEPSYPALEVWSSNHWITRENKMLRLSKSLLSQVTWWDLILEVRNGGRCLFFILHLYFLFENFKQMQIIILKLMAPH